MRRTLSLAFVTLILLSVQVHGAAKKKAQPSASLYSRIKRDFDIMKNNLMDGKRQKQRAILLFNDFQSSVIGIYAELFGPLHRASERSWNAFTWRLARLVYNFRHVEDYVKRIAWQTHVQTEGHVKALLGSHPALNEMVDIKLLLLNIYVLVGSIASMSLIWFFRFVLYA